MMSSITQMQPARQSDRQAMWLSVAFGTFLVLCSFGLVLAPKADSKVAVITFPWAQHNDAILAIAHADANIAAVGKVNWIAIAADDKINLVDRLYQAGAFLVIDAAMLISCGVISS